MKRPLTLSTILTLTLCLHTISALAADRTWNGGSSTGMWFPDGDRWLVRLQGATAAGEVGSSTNYYRPVDRDTIAWGSFDRVVGGERVGDVEEIIVKRRAPPPSEQ